MAASYHSALARALQKERTGKRKLRGSSYWHEHGRGYAVYDDVVANQIRVRAILDCGVIRNGYGLGCGLEGPTIGGTIPLVNQV
jgi:hypothetical protein